MGQVVATASGQCCPAGWSRVGSGVRAHPPDVHLPLQIPGARTRVWWGALRLPGQEGEANPQRGPEVLPANYLSAGLLPQPLHMVCAPHPQAPPCAPASLDQTTSSPDPSGASGSSLPGAHAVLGSPSSAFSGVWGQGAPSSEQVFGAGVGTARGGAGRKAKLA